MKRNLIFALTLVLVGFAFLSTPPEVTAARPNPADDFCETWFGCRTVTHLGGWAECVCDNINSFCSICCLQGQFCCIGTYCFE